MSTEYHTQDYMSKTPFIWKVLSFFSNLRKNCPSNTVRESRAFTKVVESFISISSLEQKCAILKGVLKSEPLKENMVAIGTDQLLSNSAMYKHICLENIK